MADSSDTVVDAKGENSPPVEKKTDDQQQHTDQKQTSTSENKMPSKESSNHDLTSPFIWTISERKWWMYSLFIGQACVFATRNLVPICLTSISKEFLWNKAQMGAVMSMFFWGHLTTQYVGGHIADRVGGDQVLTLSALAWAIVTFAYTLLNFNFMTTSWLFSSMVVLRILHGAFQGFHSPSVGSLMANRVLLKQRGTTYTVQRAGSYFGILLTGSLGSVLMDYFGWRMPFLLTSLVSIVWALWTRWTLLSPSSWIDPQHILRLCRFKRSTLTEWKILTKHIIYTKSDKPSLPLKILARKMPFWAMLCGHFAYGYSHFIIMNWLPTYFHDNYPEAKGWVFNVVPWIVTIPTSMMGGMIADFLIRKNYTVCFVRKFLETLALLGCGLFLMVISFVTTFNSALLCMALAVSFSGFHCSAIMLNPQDLAPNHGGSLFGIMNMAGALPGFLGVYISGFILQSTGSWPMVFQITSVVCIFGWIFFLIFGDAKQIV